MEVLPAFAALEDSQCADGHGNKGEVEDEERDDEGKQINGEIGDDEEEDKSIDVLCWDDGAQPLDASTRCPVN